MLKNTVLLAQMLLLGSCSSLSSLGRLNPRSIGADGYPNENYATRYPDFTMEQFQKDYSGKGLVMGYKVGDRFRTRQPMYLAYTANKIVYLCELIDYDVPKFADYQKNPDAFHYGGENRYQVIRVVPAGTVIQIVKIADLDATVPYFVFDRETNWFRCSAFSFNRNIEYSSRRIILGKSYNKKLFVKL